MIFAMHKAYIDPSVMTYSVQAIAGIIIAIGGVAAILWRKVRKKVQNTLKLEDKSKKEIEEAVTLKEENEEGK